MTEDQGLRPEDPLSKADERQLVERAADGDSDAVAQLYDAYERRLYGYCHRICRNPEDAADATQEAFCNVIQRMPGLDAANLNFAAYMFTAARNACMDIVKQRGRAEATDEVPEDPFAIQPLDTDPERALLTGDQREAARLANDRLPETQRTALALREVSGLSYDEIAESMEMNSNAVAQLISRARIGFAKQLRAGAVIVPPTDVDGERALTLTSERIDGKITDADLAWLDAHLNANESSRLNSEAMQESAVLYRAIGPVAVAALLREATLARANEFTGKRPADGGSSGGAGGAGGSGGFGAFAGGSEAAASTPGAKRGGTGRRAAVYATVSAIALILALVFAEGHDSTAPTDPTAELVEQAPAEAAEETKGARKRSVEPRGDLDPVTVVPSDPSGAAPTRESAERPNRKTGGKKKSTDDGSDAPATTPPPAAQPQPTPDPAPEQPDPTPPRPPGVPGGPGSICGNPNGCTVPPPVP